MGTKLSEWEIAILRDPTKKELADRVREFTTGLLSSLGVSQNSETGQAIHEFSQKLAVAIVDTVKEISENVTDDRLDSHEYREHDKEQPS